MWDTACPGQKGPPPAVFRRSAEWKRNPPFFAPTASTTLPFLIAFATSTTCDTGEDVHDVPGCEANVWQRIPRELVVHKDVHVLPSPSGLVADPVPNPGEHRLRGTGAPPARSP